MTDKPTIPCKRLQGDIYKEYCARCPERKRGFCEGPKDGK